MANIKSQIKRNRQNDKKRLRNRVYRGEARIAVRNARTTIEEGVPESKAAVLQAISALDKAAEQGVIHRNNAARRKSRLVKAFAKMEPVKVEAEPVALEPALEAAPAKTSSPRSTQRVKGKKTAPRKISATSSAKGKKVEEPKAEAAAESKAEPKKSSPKGKKAATKKPTATSSPKGKKTESKKPETKKTVTRKKPTATK